MSHSLPPELWQNIGSYLSEHTLHKTMCVNSTFFRMYMKIRYRMVVVSWEKSKAMEKVESIRDSMLSGYVKHLKLCLSPARPPNFKEFTRALLEAIKSMVNLKGISLYFHGSQNDDTEDLQSFFAELWSIVGNHLQCLELSGSLRQYDAYIPSYTLLPSLKRFIVNQDKGYLGWVENKIVPLVTGLAPQLLSLEIHDNFHAIVSELPTFPALEELKTSLWFADAWEGERVKRFLTAQTALSKPFQLHLVSYSIFAEDISAVFSSESEPYPLLSEYAKLQSLSLQYTYFPLCGDIIHSVIRAHCDTLRNLDFTSCCFRPSARHRLRDLILTISLCTQLSYLCLEVSKLDPWLLTVLSSDLPNLDSLRLNCSKIDLRLVGIWQPKSLREQSLRTWKLRDLNIYYRCKPLNNKTMKQIARHILSVQSFWKSGDMDTTPTPTHYMQWRHSHFVVDLWKSAAYRPLRAGVERIRWRLPF